MSDSNHKEGQWWSDAKRIEVVTSWLALGKIPLIAACTGVPEGTIRQWRTQPWWKETELSILTETDQELDSKLAKRIDKALDVIWDRLEHGDFMYDPKSGEFVRKPVGLKETNKVMVDMMDKRMLIRKQPREQQNQEAVNDILKNLAREFEQMAKKKLKEVDNGSQQSTPSAEELQTGIRQLPGSTEANS